MADTKKLRVQRSVTDLDTLQEVTLAKEIDFAPVTSIPEATARLSNDSAKLISIINEGLRAEARRVAGGDPADWHTLTDDGEVNGPFTGTVADSKAVNSLVLTLAKTVYGYNKDQAKDVRDSAKDQAMEMIKSTPAIKAGLQKSAALKPEPDESEAAAQ